MMLDVILGVSFLGVLASMQFGRRKVNETDSTSSSSKKKAPTKFPIQFESYTDGHQTVEDVVENVRCMLDANTRECDLADPVGSCATCIGGAYGCQRIVYPVSLQLADVGEELTVIYPPEDTSKGRCLPLKTKDFVCNPWSGMSILATTAAKPENYFWFCKPTRPSIVTKSSFFSDADDDSYACGGIGVLTDPYTGNRWRESPNFDPLDGECECPDGYVHDWTTSAAQKLLTCVTDPCYPGKSSDDGSCKCPDGFVRCGANQPHFADWELQFHCPQAVRYGVTFCVRDPCEPLGRMDKKTSKCKLAEGVDPTEFAVYSDRTIERGYVRRFPKYTRPTPYSCPARR